MEMARYDMPTADMGQMSPGQITPGPAAAEVYFRLGIESSTGRGGPVDLVSAHKWFNIAAAKGSRDAIRMRSEVAAEMSSGDIAEAQRAAREFLRLH
jgi:TPR repeat protein